MKTSSVSGSGRYAPPQIFYLLVSTSVYKFFGGGGSGRDCVSWYWALWPPTGSILPAQDD